MRKNIFMFLFLLLITSCHLLGQNQNFYEVWKQLDSHLQNDLNPNQKNVIFNNQCFIVNFVTNKMIIIGSSIDYQTKHVITYNQTLDFGENFITSNNISILSEFNKNLITILASSLNEQNNYFGFLHFNNSKESATLIFSRDEIYNDLEENSISKFLCNSKVHTINTQKYLSTSFVMKSVGLVKICNCINKFPYLIDSKTDLITIGEYGIVFRLNGKYQMISYENKSPYSLYSYQEITQDDQLLKSINHLSFSNSITQRTYEELIAKSSLKLEHWKTVFKIRPSIILKKYN